MTKKLSARLLSVILTLAICATTVFGCLMTVNAASAPSYVIAEEMLKKYATGGTTKVTFNVPDGMSAGIFTVDGDWYESVTVAFDSGTNKNGAYSGADDFEIEVSKEDDSPAVVVFRINNSQNETLTNANGEVDPKLYSTVTFSLSFVFTAPIIANIDVTISDLDFVGIYAEDIYATEDFAATSGMFLAGCPHTYVVDTSADSLLYSELGSYSVYQKAECSKCGEIIEGYQVLPESAGNTTTYEWSLLAVNITYNPDGSTNLNFHYDPITEAKNISLYVPTSTESDKAKFQKITEPTTSSYAGTTFNDQVFSTNAKMFTIKNLSARDIDLLWLPTVVVEYEDGAVAYGKTEQISIEEYATQVILGKATYSTTDSADADKIKLDKDVAAALINYGYAADAALNVKGITSDEAGAVSEYSGTPDANLSGEGTETNPYIIKTADQFAAVALGYITDATENTCFKVDDGINAFYMNGGETVANMTDVTAVKAYFEKNGGKNWSLKNSQPFTGQFDGNGVTVYGIYCYQTGDWTPAGLFPQVTGHCSIKNITLKNSYISGNYKDQGCVGGIVGSTVLDKSNAEDYSTSVDFANISIIRNYIRSTRGAILGASALAGYFYNRHYAFVNNLLIYGNEIDNMAYEDTDGDGLADRTAVSGLFTYNKGTGYSGYEVAKNAKIENVVAIGVTPWSLGYDGASYSNGGYYLAVLQGQMRNIYTDQPTDDLVKCDSNNSAALATYNINSVAAADMQGSKAMTTTAACVAKNASSSSVEADLDWENTWAYGLTGEYPVIVGPNSSNVKAVSKYSGTPDTALAGSGTETDPYIIKTADQFAAVALGKITTATEDTYFEVDPGVKAFYMHGGAAVAAMSSSAEVKKYFDTNGKCGKGDWISTTFTGQFDGNGVTIYGVYSNGTYAGLFQTVAGHSSIKNLTLKNSYIKSNYSNGIGAIVGVTNWRGGSDYNYDITTSVAFENVAVINNYVCSTSTSGYGACALGGYFHHRHFASVNNCLIYGNEFDNSAYNQTTVDANSDGIADGDLVARSGLFASVSGIAWSGSASGTAVGYGEEYADKLAAAKTAAANSKIENVIAIGITPWTVGTSIATNSTTGEKYISYNHGGWNLTNINASVFKNIYTDQSTTLLYKYSSANNDSLLAKYNINVVKAEDMQGASAKTVATVLAWDTTWFAGAYNDYPSFSEPTKLTSALQSKYDALTLSNYDDYYVTETTSHDCYMYASSLNLKVNPYIAFTFAFRGDYAADKPNVKVTLTTADGKGYTTTANEMVNNTDPDNFAGRYHLYRFKDVPVEYLCQDISVKVEYGVTTIELGTFSVEGFALDAYNANRIMPSLYYSTRAEAAKALLFYTQMINARYGSVE